MCDNFLHLNKVDTFKVLAKADECGFIKYGGRNDYSSCWMEYMDCPMTMEETREIVMDMMRQDMLAIPDVGTEEYKIFIYITASM